VKSRLNGFSSSPRNGRAVPPEYDDIDCSSTPTRNFVATFHPVAKSSPRSLTGRSRHARRGHTNEYCEQSSYFDGWYEVNSRPTLAPFQIRPWQVPSGSERVHEFFLPHYKATSVQHEKQMHAYSQRRTTVMPLTAPRTPTLVGSVLVTTIIKMMPLLPRRRY